MKPECNNCRWNFKRYMDYYPCCDCIGLHKSASYNFFCFPISLMFGVAELCHWPELWAACAYGIWQSWL